MAKRGNASAEESLFRRPPDLAAELRRLMRQIPAGRVATCGGLARGLGNIAAARWIGTFLRDHDHDEACPCHRVLLSTGKLGGYIGDLKEKSLRLATEGIDVADEAVDLAAHEFSDFQGSRPLESLAAGQQQQLKERLVLRRLAMPRHAAGVDVSYDSEGNGVAALALVDVTTGALVQQVVVRREVSFPYITSFLAYRELPLVLAVLDEAHQVGLKADAILVDGAGIMHPRGAGIASQLGVLTGVPTIGVTKKLLFGSYDPIDMQPGDMRDVTHEGRRLGVAIRHRPKSPRPLFVSPGHLTDVASASRIVSKLLRGRPLPEPIYWADRLSRRAVKERAER